VKRRDLVDKLAAMGCVLLRHGSRHDIYHNPVTGNSEPVPRHREISDNEHDNEHDNEALTVVFSEHRTLNTKPRSGTVHRPLSTVHTSSLNTVFPEHRTLNTKPRSGTVHRPTVFPEHRTLTPRLHPQGGGNSTPAQSDTSSAPDRATHLSIPSPVRPRRLSD
jgi:mRNA interferase HicA